jgi:hypothetical protein
MVSELFVLLLYPLLHQLLGRVLWLIDYSFQLPLSLFNVGFYSRQSHSYRDQMNYDYFCCSHSNLGFLE